MRQLLGAWAVVALLSERESRPSDRAAASSTTIKNVLSLSLEGHVAERPRCRRCGHPVFSPESIRLGVGRDCRRRARAAGVVA